MTELRTVARFAVESADEVLPVFEEVRPDDRRPRVAIGAAWTFIDGADRSKLQRTASLDAHRAAKDAADGLAQHAAHAAGDAASAAYLHPPGQVRSWTSELARSTQVGHILRAAAHAARVAELRAGDDPGVGELHIERTRRRASPAIIDIVRRYPPVATGRNRVAVLMKALDTALRSR